MSRWWSHSSQRMQMSMWLIITGLHLSTVQVTVERCNLVSIVEKLLAAGAELNALTKNGNTPLAIAAHNGHIDLVEKLLNAGATVDTMTMWNQVTRLDFASERGYTEIVEMLLAAGANVNHVTTCDKTPLIRATTGGHLDVIKSLLAAGVRIDFVPGQGDSAFMCATRCGHHDIAPLLMDAGANPFICDKDGNVTVSPYLK